MHLKDVTGEICAQSLLKYPEVFLLIKSLFCTFLNFNFLARLVGRLPAACLPAVTECKREGRMGWVVWIVEWKEKDGK